MNVKKFIDLHVHIGPELIPRKFTAESIQKSETGKLAGLALKNHFYSTVPFIEQLREQKDILLIGSITLNNYIGGLNPNAVYASAKLSKSPILVWFPTLNADNFLRQSKYEIPPEWVGKNFKSRESSEVQGIKITQKDGSLTTEALNVLRAIKETNSILATGHISWQETKNLVEEAVKLGIKQIIVTHPIYQLINIPIEVQTELSKNTGVYMEQSYAMYLIDKIPIKKIAEQIKIIGADKCILSSDVGQIKSPPPSSALQDFTELLKSEGITEEELKIMGEINPSKIIGIKKTRTLLNKENLEK